ncbi:metal-dependent hydrolase [Candidatus Woesearchaeota archaeon]|nr:metal-dependent hydrolase [Candidatus Woesearchaeota archaeon]
MPQAVVHVLFVIIVLDLFRDHFLKDKRELPLHYIFIGGIAGLLPDIDVLLFWILNNFLGIGVPWFHRIFTHTFLFVLIFLFISLIYFDFNRKSSKLFAVIAFGVAFHIFLDWLLVGGVAPFYPFSGSVFGLNLIGRLNLPLAVEGLEAFVLLWWLWHEEKLHRISDFI